MARACALGSRVLSVLSWFEALEPWTNVGTVQGLEIRAGLEELSRMLPKSTK